MDLEKIKTFILPFPERATGRPDRLPDTGISRAMLPEKATLSTLSPGEKGCLCPPSVSPFERKGRESGIPRTRPPLTETCPSHCLRRKGFAGRKGEEFSLREISREKLDWERHFSAALDKGDHMAAHGKRFAPSVRVWDSKLKIFAKSSVLLIP